MNVHKKLFFSDMCTERGLYYHFYCYYHCYFETTHFPTTAFPCHSIEVISMSVLAGTSHMGYISTNHCGLWLVWLGLLELSPAPFCTLVFQGGLGLIDMHSKE